MPKSKDTNLPKGVSLSKDLKDFREYALTLISNPTEFETVFQRFLDNYEIDIENLFHESSIEDSDYLRLLEKVSFLKNAYLAIQKEVIALEITLSNLKNSPSK